VLLIKYQLNMLVAGWGIDVIDVILYAFIC